jgi:predicted transcriptional regulator
VPLTATAISYANEEVRYILELPEQSVQERIVQTISQGYTEADAIAKAINQDRDRVFVWLSRLVEQGVLTIREQTLEERAPGARGPARHYYEIA